MQFPIPHHIGQNCTRWRLSEVAAFEARRLGEAAPAFTPENERYLSADQVAERLAISRGTVWRWARESQGRAA